MSAPAASAHVHRGTRAVQALIERAPATGSLALWMQHRDVDRLDVAAPVATDGRTLRYTPAFESLELAAQVGWVAHQVLHVAFRHVARREDLGRLVGDVDDELYNACADALVNSTLSHLAWLTLPRGALHLDTLVQRVLQRDLSLDAALLEYDVERLYREIDDRRGAGKVQSRGGRAVRGGDGRGAGRRDRGRGPTPTDRAVAGAQQALGDGRDAGRRALRPDGPRSAAVRALLPRDHLDLLVGGVGERPEEAAGAVREWSQRLVRGHASDGEFSILRTLSADLPRSRVPWRDVLRSRLCRALVREPDVSWSRPARSWLANQGKSASGRRLPFEPGVVTSRQVPRLVVVLDVSGSIDDALLQRLGRQLNAISRQTSSVCVVVVGDDRVRRVDERPPGRIDLASYQFDGGGGTNFAPLLAEAAQHRPDYVVVLTDLDGPAGPAPTFPVLWAVAAEHAHAVAPFGHVLVID